MYILRYTEYPHDKVLKVDTFFYNFWHILPPHATKLPTSFWIQWQITCFPASLSMSGFILGENLSSKIEYTVAALIYISLITNEVQYFFHMCIGYLNFFFSKMSIHSVYSLCPWGFVLLFVYRSSLHVKNINAFWQLLPQTLRKMILPTFSTVCLLCMVLFLTHKFLAKSISAFLFGFWCCVDV